jgi:hypothetical protein
MITGTFATPFFSGCLMALLPILFSLARQQKLDGMNGLRDQRAVVYLGQLAVTRAS